jgi:hypothetical protein
MKSKKKKAPVSNEPGSLLHFLFNYSGTEI